jgi:hypothetical protein
MPAGTAARRPDNQPSAGNRSKEPPYQRGQAVSQSWRQPQPTKSLRSPLCARITLHTLPPQPCPTPSSYPPT